ncbi:MAG: DUF3786 domain-containing protein [Dissulfuribacterales bacterium]
MPKINNPMEIFKLLNNSNCRDCNEKTCLAFAVAVFKNKRQLNECPHLSQEIIEKYGRNTERPNTIDEYMIEAVENLKRKIPGIDLSEAARRLGAAFSGNKLTIKIFGKDFSVDLQGHLSTDIHVNPWVAVPVLNYVLKGAGKQISGDWVPFRELKNGRSRAGLYHQRCENPLKKIADTYTDFFKDMLEIFDGHQVDNLFDSDVSIVLHPLPLVPILICYWEPEDGLESSLHIFFDATAEDNLDIDSLYTLAAGFVHMFEKISLRHGVKS